MELMNALKVSHGGELSVEESADPAIPSRTFTRVRTHV